MEATKSEPKAGTATTEVHFVLRLFVAGATENSKNAICNVRKACEEHLQGCYQLQVVDVYQTPVLAVSENIVATPTLVLPSPLRRVIGDLSHERVLVGLQTLETTGASWPAPEL